MKLLAVLFLTFCFAVCCTQEKQNDKNTVVSLLDGNIPHLDPIHSTNRYSSTINGAIFEGLYHYHYLKDPMSVEPALAESLPKITNGGRTYTIKIKKGVFFQDDPAFPDNRGRELEANDFVYSWKRLADPQNKAMGWWIFDGKIEGLNSWRNGVRKGQAQYDSPVSGLKALDSHTLQITLTQPSYQFLHLLCVPATSVVAHEVVEKYKKDIGNHPVGTGPFRLKKWVRNSEVVLEKNPKYREAFFPSDGAPANRPDLKKHAGASLPMADEVVVRIITEKQPEWLAFLKGELDHGIIPKDNNAQVIENGQLKAPMKAKGLSLHDLHKMDFTYIAFNMEDPVLGKHPKLRQAMAMALDRTLILEKFYNNRGLLAQGPIPPGIAGYNKDFQSPLVYNVKRAQELMTEAGFPNGEGLPVFNYDTANGPFFRQSAELIKDLWSRIGVKIRIRTNTWPQFDKKVKTKKATLFDMAWTADYPDAENFLQIFYSNNISPGSNHFNYVDRNYDSLFTQFLTLPDSPERDQLIEKMVTKLNEDVPAVFMIHRRFKLPYHAWLENYYERPMVYDHLKYLKVDPQKKKEYLNKL